MAQERIQKIMSEQGLCSRRAAEQIIAEGRVKLNGHTAKVGDKMDPTRDLLSVDGQNIHIEKNQQMYYIALYKPRGYVTTASDELGRKTVLDLLKNIPARVYPVGRLDRDSEGLLLLTNDGEFANAMMHPSGEVTKLYRVTVRPHATEAQVLKLSQGVVLDDGTKTLPAVINVVTDEPGRTVMEMTLREGKNREIRRMCEAVDLEVIRLKRSAEGAVRLGMLQPGEYRELTKQELSALRAAAAKGRARTRTEGQQERAAARTARKERMPEEGKRTAPAGYGAKSGAPRGAGQGRTYDKPTGRTDYAKSGAPHGEKKTYSAAGRGRPSAGKTPSGTRGTGKPGPHRKG